MTTVDDPKPVRWHWRHRWTRWSKSFSADDIHGFSRVWQRRSCATCGREQIQEV